MSELLKIQTDFLNGIFHKDESILKHIDKVGAISPKQRLQIYQNNAYLILTEVLRDTFPAINKMVSNDFFNYSAHEFIKLSPPNAGDMNNYGSGFPEFLEKFKPLEEHSYLGDLARLEWLRHQSYLSHKQDSLEAKDLESLTSSEIENMKLSLQPHVFILKSAWPIDKIYKLSIEGEAEDFNMRDTPSNLVIFQKNKEVVVWSVTSAVFTFLNECHERKTFREAMTKATQIDTNFITSNAFGDLINEGLFCSINKTEQST